LKVIGSLASLRGRRFCLTLRTTAGPENCLRFGVSSNYQSRSRAGWRSVAKSSASATKARDAGARVGVGPTVSVAARSQRIGSGVVGHVAV
jgi:hypothetical protein